MRKKNKKANGNLTEFPAFPQAEQAKYAFSIFHMLTQLKSRFTFMVDMTLPNEKLKKQAEERIMYLNQQLEEEGIDKITFTLSPEIKENEFTTTFRLTVDQKLVPITIHGQIDDPQFLHYLFASLYNIDHYIHEKKVVPESKMPPEIVEKLNEAVQLLENLAKMPRNEKIPLTVYLTSSCPACKNSIITLMLFGFIADYPVALKLLDSGQKDLMAEAHEHKIDAVPTYIYENKQHKGLIGLTDLYYFITDENYIITYDDFENNNNN